ncbi:SH3 and PX domain-containing protein 2A-like isoform X2 [Patiria miniata]|uniref:SH3 and PX domain-containing protein 2A n=1 Tax=Patiria miniata TaxID=46514 RepID=A0A913Z2S9_PATMI|nr:SH3 and PX domain-containing protein 2A-like isoform X2 [Patiria miniata]
MKTHIATPHSKIFRRHPSSEYVIHVSWSDGSVNVVYRRYSKFFDFQMKLLSIFPEEAGARNPTQRMIPFLPGKKLFGRSQTREVASRRLGQLNEYCQLLVRLPPKISESDEVLQFFTPTAEDINPVTESDTFEEDPTTGGVIKKGAKEIDVISDPIQPDPYIVIADYKKQQKNEVDLHTGDNVEVFEKNDNGWWFVSSNDSQGWAPATFLSRADGGDDEDGLAGGGTEERYISNNSYKAQQEDEVSFETGVVLIVMQKSLDGWWKVRYKEKIGWVPAAFLQVYTGPADVTASTPTQRVGNVMSVSDIISRRQAADSSKNSPMLGRKDNLHSHGTEAKPTPPRRTTVRPGQKTDDERTVRKGATRKRRPTATKKTLEYYTVADFSDSAGDSISFKSGQKVQIIQETESGWWLVKIGDEEGWAPSSYMEAKEETVAETRPQPSNRESLDEETGESSPRPPRPPPPTGRKISNGGATSSSSGTGGFRPVSTPGGSKSSGAASAFRPVSMPSSNNGRPLPVTPAFKPAPPALKPTPQTQPKPFRPSSGGGSNLIQNAQANLKPVRSQSKPPLVNRQKKPGAQPNGSPIGTPGSNVQPSQIADLQNQLKSLKTPSSGGVRDRRPSNAYVTTAAYENVDDDDGLSFEEGVQVEVIEENDTGWWLVRIAGEEGWAPSTYLEKA